MNIILKDFLSLIMGDQSSTNVNYYIKIWIWKDIFLIGAWFLTEKKLTSQIYLM